MTVLITGSRAYRDWPKVKHELNRLHASTPITLLVHGGALGADFMGARWAEAYEVNCLRVPAKWSTHGKAAGPLRNTEMLQWKPDRYVAFPTSDSIGTYDMIHQLNEAGIPGEVFEG